MRVAVLRLLAAVSALSWLVWPGFAVPDLAVTWDPAWPVVLEAGWGLFAGVLVAGAFLRLAVRPRSAGTPLRQLVVATAALIGATALAGDAAAVRLAGLLAAQTAAVWALARPGQERPEERDRSVPLLLLGALAAGPAAAYAARMVAAVRQGPAVDVTVGVDHATVQAALAMALPALVLLAAVRPRGSAALAAGAAVCAAYLGVVSLAEPGTAAGLPPVWSAAAVVWGVAVLAAAVLPVRAVVPARE